MATITDKAIRAYLGHNGHECRVRISRDGMVSRYGSPEPTDRSKDYWQYVGYRDQLADQMAWESSIVTQPNEEI